MDDKMQAAEAVFRDALAGGVGVLIAGKRLPPSEFYQDAVKEAERLKEAAKLFRSDPRFRALVDSTVAEAFNEHGRIDPDRPERDAHSIATWASALLLARIYEQDAELKAMRAERDGFRTLAENAFNSLPRPLTWTPPKPKEPGSHD